MFPPVFPTYIPRLVPFYDYGPLIWLAGMVCLWLTRYTHQLGERWGGAYYALSALVRPLGIVFMAVGWLVLYASPEARCAPPGYRIPWLGKGEWLSVLCWLGIVLSTALGAWAVAVLGARRSFLFRRTDDRLVTRGPYSLVRHPQFLSAIGITLCTILLYNPSRIRYVGDAYPISLTSNWVLFTLALWLLSIIENRELAAHFGEEYEQYAQRVPRLFPN